ncbi:MAG: NTP transferase domain-containing protein, partial [Paracoccaceae bacterium]|nr:NTP transferase domain-containing protein [Paracoccaceae bacterium]
MSLPILFFAAGLGTRMGTLTAQRPKPLIKVGGKALIDHALQIAEVAQVGTKVVNLHYKGDMIRQHLKDQDVLFSDESDMLLETGGGLRLALPLLEG